MKKVSVIMPVYNVEEYVEQAIMSVLKQTYSNFELIIVDDGTEDNSALICEGYMKKDSRIQLIHKRNGGLSDARNYGLKYAKGDYIYFIDSDDYIEENLLKKCVETIERDSSDMVVFNYRKVEQNGNDIGNSMFRPEIIDIDDEYSFISSYLLEYKLGWEAWGRMFRAKVIKENNLFFWNNKEIFAEDLAFFLVFSSYMQRVSVISDILYNYRIRDDSIMGKVEKVPLHKFFSLLQRYNDWNISMTVEQKNIVFMSIISNELEKEVNSIGELVNELGQEDFELLQCENEKYRRNNLKKDICIRKRVCLHILDGYIHKQKCRTFMYTNVYKIATDSINFLRGIGMKNPKQYLWNIYKKWNTWLYIRKYRVSEADVLLIGTEDFGNLGDQMISISEIKYLNDLLDVKVFEITASEYNKINIKGFAKVVMSDVPIFLTGGGNFGSDYPFSDNIKFEVISLFPDNKKIVFPCTISYGEGSEENKIKNRDIKILGNDKNTLLSVRDEESYKIARLLFKDTEVCLIPDIVLINNFADKYSKKRRGALLCIRNDKESILSEEQKLYIKTLAKNKYGNVEETDTQKKINISKEQREAYIEKELNKFASSDIVITDRLHGMIFSVITGTPCISFDNKNKKNKGAQKWVNDIRSVRYVEEISELEDILNADLVGVYDSSDLYVHFQNFRDKIKTFIKE